MDREVVEQKLEFLRRIETKCPTDAATLVMDIDLQDIVALNLSRAVQICADIGAHLIAGMEVPPPDTMGQTFDLLAQTGVLNNELASSLKKAVGFHYSRFITMTVSTGLCASHSEISPRGFFSVCQGGRYAAGKVTMRHCNRKKLLGLAMSNGL